MADPTVQSFCCRRQLNHLLLATDTLLDEFGSKPYLVTSLCCSMIGMVGALYQLLIRYYLNRDGDFRMYYLQNMRYFPVPKRLVAQSVGKKLLLWLAAADLFASAGVFIRATFWIYVRPNAWNSSIPESSRIIFCAVISGLIQYFYTCTWLYTLCYAFNIRTYLRDEVIAEKKYHSFVWTTAALLTAIGTTVLYFPNATCHSFDDLYTSLTRVLPNYCATYLPIILVMIINPVLYHSASNSIDSEASGSSQYTTAERHLNTTLKWKFLMINVVFYVCWIPNLICGIILWTMWHKLPEPIIIPIWYLMAIVNPLQAFFNTLVYRKWQPAVVSGTTIIRGLRSTDPTGERAPLLQRPPIMKATAPHPPFHPI